MASHVEKIESAQDSLPLQPPALGSAVEVQAILPLALRMGRGVIASDALAIWLYDTQRREWRIAASEGLSETFVSGSLPSTGADLAIEVVHSEDVTRELSLRSRLPLYEQEGIRAFLAVPLILEQQRRGTITFYFQQPHQFTEFEIQLATALANLTSSALMSAELYGRQSRAKARSDFLAEAGSALAASMDYGETLQTVAQLAISRLADSCSVDILQDGSLQRLAIAHVTAEGESILRELSRRYPPSMGMESAIGRVLASGKSDLYQDFSNELLERAAQDPQHLELLRLLDLHSALVVPLRARGKILGVMGLATSVSGRHFNHEDLALAEDLAQRAAVALENSKLFQALRESEQKFRAVSEAAACAIYIHDGRRLLYINRAAQAASGYTFDELAHRDIWDMVHPDDRELVKARAAARLRGEDVPSRYEFRCVAKDGSVIWTDFSAAITEYGGRRALLGTAFDITDRKATLDLLQQRELEARTLLNNLPDVVSRFDRNLRYMYVSPHAEKITGIPASHYIGKTFEEVGLPSALCRQWTEGLREVFETRRSGQLEFQRIDKSGGVRRIVSTAVPEITEQGEVQSVLAISHDVTDQRAAQERLRRSEAELRLIIDSIPGLVAYVDTEQRLRRVNMVFEQWFQSPLRNFIGMHLRDLLGANYEHVQAGVERALRGETVHFSTTNQYADKFRHVLITYTPDFDATGEICGFVALVADITERAAAEEAMRKTEKLAATGRLAASIAHEINNPLESVTNILYLLHSETGLSEAGQNYLALAELELQRVSQIATQTLRFHRQATRPTTTKVEEVLDGVLALYERRLSAADIVVEKSYGGMNAIEAFEGELRQLFGNLITNAVDACSTGGRLLLRTRAVADTRGRSGVRITIADSGHGIPAEMLDHIFEPFITTKASTGTGLGLWVSKEIAEKHGGSIRVRSSVRPGSTGTVFVVFLADLRSL